MTRFFGLMLLGVLALAAGMGAWGAWHTTVEHPAPPRVVVVNDVTQLNPIEVADVITPTTTAEIVAAVRAHAGPISIGGGRYSMGGQTATRGALQIDMRTFNKVLAFDSVAKTITVQPGIRWREVQQRIDPANLSVKIMQTYANFTVGGSMSVNAHGRYIGLGPLVLSVRSLKLVLANGTLVDASPTRNAEIFYGAIGGYGAMGVIVEATLDLADNVRVKRRNIRMPLLEYPAYFKRDIRDSTGVIFHNADIYPPKFEHVNAVSWSRTSDPVTISDRLMPADKSYRLNRFAYTVMSEWPLGKQFREYLLDPILFRKTPVEWRNYEASYDVAELEPSSRKTSTYVLQEYFIPVERFNEFVPRMRSVFRKHDVNVINVSIRHALPDPGTLLAWARHETFAFVVYYKQGTSANDRRKVGVWTREMTDSILGVGGTYYLPYQPWATESQFLRAYPNAPTFFALKQRLDPTNKFRNALWDKYYLPRVAPENAQLDAAVRERLDSAGTYARDEGQTFLTHPRWYVVYSADEYAEWLQTRLPTGFPYASSIAQFWMNYREAAAQTSGTYSFSTGSHLMLWVIGSSYSAELALKGVYENTIGRLSDWASGGAQSDEDKYAADVAADYGRFIHDRPWYEYRFAGKLRGLWTDLPWWGPGAIRKLERRAFLTVEYGFKAVYATLFTLGRAAFEPRSDRMQMVLTGWNESVAARHPAIKTVARLDSVFTVVAAPRYDGFRDAVQGLADSKDRVHITEIAGNREICLTGVAPRAWTYQGTGRVLFNLPLPTDSARKRVTMRVPVTELLPVLTQLRAKGRDNGLAIDHVYDY